MESSITLCLLSSPPFIPSKALAPWHSGFFPQALTSLHSYIKKTSWWRAWLHFVFSVLLAFIPFEPLAPWCSGFFPQTLISVHSYIEKTFWWKAQSLCFLSEKRLKFTLRPKAINFLNLPIARMAHETYL
jgi:hypothetical protein